MVDELPIAAFRFVASSGFSVQESAPKPPQAIFKMLIVLIYNLLTLKNRIYST